MTSATGITTFLSPTLYKPQVNSIPSIKLSTKISLHILKAPSTAASKSAAVFTLDTPKLEPSALGFTKQGKPTAFSTASLSKAFPLTSMIG